MSWKLPASSLKRQPSFFIKWRLPRGGLAVPSNDPPTCLTRVVVDGDQDGEVAELQSVMERIESALRYVVPRSHQAYIGNALLNLAVSRMVREAGVQRTATMLIRLVDTVLEGSEPPSPQAPVDLTATHS